MIEKGHILKANTVLISDNVYLCLKVPPIHMLGVYSTVFYQLRLKKVNKNDLKFKKMLLLQAS